MNTKRSHKIFSLVMLILIVGGLSFGAIASIYSVIEYKEAQREKEQEAIAAMEEARSEAAISEAVNSEVVSEQV